MTTEPRRRTRNSLNVEEILDVAERAANDGFDTLTIRAVATELGASPMALYRYFASKDELIDALLDRVLSRMAAPHPSDDASLDLEDFARRHRALLMAHPWAVTPLISRPLPGPHALPIGEDALGILMRLGITGDHAVATFSGIIAFNYGWVAFALASTAAPATSSRARISQPPARGFPVTESLAEPMSRYGADDHYDIALAQLLTGIRTTARPLGPVHS